MHRYQAAIPTMTLKNNLVKDVNDKVACTLRNFVNVPDDLFDTKEFMDMSTSLPTLLAKFSTTPDLLCSEVEKALVGRLRRVIQDYSMDVQCITETATDPDKYNLKISVIGIPLNPSDRPLDFSELIYTDSSDRLSLTSELEHSVDITEYM